MVLFPSEADVEMALLAVVDTVGDSLQNVGRVQVRLQLDVIELNSI